MNPKVAVRSRQGHEHVEHYAVKDPHTIEIKLKDSFAPYLVSWQKTSVIPKHILASVPDINTAPFNTNPVGTGPFKFKERVAGSYISFEPNPKYHGGAPKLTSLIQKYVPDQQTLFAQFQTGEVDVYDIQGIPPLLYQRAKAIPARRPCLNPNPFVEFIYLQLRQTSVRGQAGAQGALHGGRPQGMDRRRLLRRASSDAELPAPEPLGLQQGARRSRLRSEEGGALLDEAGWKVASDGVRAKDGVRLAFTMSTTAGNKSREQAQQLVQQNLKKINVEMTIKNMPASVVWGDYTVQSQFDTLDGGLGRAALPRPGLWRPHPLHRYSGQGRQRLELCAVPESGNRQAFRSGAWRPPISRSARRSTTRSRRSCSTTCPSPRSSPTSRSSASGIG